MLAKSVLLIREIRDQITITIKNNLLSYLHCGKIEKFCIIQKFLNVK